MERPSACSRRGPDGLPSLNFTDPRVKLADMTGDGLQDIVLVYSGNIAYWPNLGHGHCGSRVRMANSPRLPNGHDPARVLLGDIGGDGPADLVYVDNDCATVWFNRSGNGWSDPITVKGTPAPGIGDSLRVVDLLGAGTGGILYSRDMRGPGRPSMFFLDFTGGVKPRLLTRMDNNIGALTEVDYAPSTRFALADAARPATRWRTPLPIVVPVVARVTVCDQISRGKLVTEYSYHHGYWDGTEREFRGFGRVDQIDTQTFDDYHAASGLGPFSHVSPSFFSPPTLTKTWFHLGPVNEDDGNWAGLDWSNEYWDGDPNLLGHTERVNAFLRTLLDPTGRSDRRARRDALRTLHGSILRTELYALDGSARQNRPYTVTEQAYDLRGERSETESGRPRVFFPFLTAQRTSQWERGDDPMTQFTFIADYDQFGQSGQQTMTAVPRRSARRRVLTGAVIGEFCPDDTVVLASHTRTMYAEADDHVYIHDRVAQVRTYELIEPPEVAETNSGDVRAILADQASAASAVREVFNQLPKADIRLIGHQLNHYDGPGFTGLEVGQAGRYGALTRTETLVFTDEILDKAYGKSRPNYLDGSASLPSGAPSGFGSTLGYRKEPAGPVYTAGFYTDTLRRRYDFQASTPEEKMPQRGLSVGIQDALGNQTDIRPDPYWLAPQIVCDPAALETWAEYDYRIMKPHRIVDPNGHATLFTYDSMGLLTTSYLRGRDGEGGTERKPEVRHAYDFLALTRKEQPIHVHTTRRVYYASENISDEVVETREYSDGFGRSIQKRTQVDGLAFGEVGDDVGLLMPNANGSPRPVPGQASGPARAIRVADRVVVSGWQLYDNKGQLVEKYDPFFDRGWDFQPEEDAKQGRRVTMRYDARHRLVRTVNADCSEARTIYGVPADLEVPDNDNPTPWVTTVYDANDLAPLSTCQSGASLIGKAPAAHHFTPKTVIMDALSRTLCQLTRCGPTSADWHATRSSYDVHGNVLTVTDQLGRTAFRYTYDLMNRLLQMVSIDAGDRLSVPDAAGNLVQVQDSRQCVELRMYDRLNRLIRLMARDRQEQGLTLRESMIYGDGGDPRQPTAEREAARSADRLGRYWRHFDEAGLVVADQYDFSGKVTEQARQVISDTALAAGESLGGWTADWAATDATAALDDREYRTRTRYDALDRIIELVADATGCQTHIVPSYNRSGTLCAVTVDGTPYVHLIAYNVRGQRVLIAYGNGLMTRYAYDPQTSRLTRLRSEGARRDGEVWSATGHALQDLTYSYDLSGNITNIEECIPGCGVAASPHGRDQLVRTFRYDPIYRLTSASGRACIGTGRARPYNAAGCGHNMPYSPGSTTPNQANGPDLTELYTETYCYDPAGNLLDMRYQALSGARCRRFGIDGGAPTACDASPSAWNEAANNHVTSVHAGSEKRELYYDQAGNLKQENADRTYTLDHAGRMTAFQIRAGSQPSKAARYLYGADGIRVKKWVRSGNSASFDKSTVYIDQHFEHHRWAKSDDGETLIHVLDGTSSVALIRGGHLHPDDRGPAIRYQLGDHLGNVAVTADASGQWVNREEYFPYGETSFGGFSRKRYRFTGRERDGESSLAYHGARYLALWLARWVSPDPAGIRSGPNVYAYCRGDPVSRRDLTGLADEPPQGTSVKVNPHSAKKVGVENQTGTYNELKGVKIGGDQPTIREHGIPGAQLESLTWDKTRGEGDYRNHGPEYRGDEIFLNPTDRANAKTHKHGPTPSDNARSRGVETLQAEARAGTGKGASLNEHLIEPSINRMVETGTPIATAEERAMSQAGKLFASQRLTGSASKAASFMERQAAKGKATVKSIAPIIAMHAWGEIREANSERVWIILHTPYYNLTSDDMGLMSRQGWHVDGMQGDSYIWRYEPGFERRWLDKIYDALIGSDVAESTWRSWHPPWDPTST